MGTPAAVAWATLYFAFHENTVLLPQFRSSLFYYRRNIDDVLGIWLCEDPATWTHFKSELNNFSRLKWDIEEPSHTVNFLDVTLTLKNGTIETTTFQKEQNLYLYLPPSSCHPHGTIKGTIYGLIGRYFAYEQA